jgi:hypothetical protein
MTAGNLGSEDTENSGFLVARTVDTLYMKPKVVSLKIHVTTATVGHSKAVKTKGSAGTVIEAWYHGDSAAIYLNSVKRKGVGRPGRSVLDKDEH